MNCIHLSLLVSIYCMHHSSSEITCPRGHNLQTITEYRDACIPCQAGVTYIQEENHTLRRCYECTKIQNTELEILVTECNTTHDTQILCQQGYYRYKARNNGEKDTCKMCRDCKNYIRKCDRFSDTVCCPSNHDAVLISSNIFFCKERLLQCDPGHYFSTSDKICVPCPGSTYMYHFNHTNTACTKCETLSQKEIYHSTIVHECNATSPTVFGCEDGHFRDILKESLMIEVNCIPCQKCQKEVRKCDMYHDAICYEGHHVTPITDDVLKQVSETKGQVHMYPFHHTTQTDPVCEEGYYLFKNISDGVLICLQCSNVTSSQENSYGTRNTTILACNTPMCLLCRNVTSSLETFDGTGTNCSTIQNCNTDIGLHNSKHGQFQVYSIILFTLSILVDILYVFLYSRNFLKKNSSFFSRRNSQTSENVSRLIGTVGIDLHLVLIFIHLFGILCEIRIVHMDEDTLWTFTIAVGIISLLFYFTDAILFAIVKRVVIFPACIKRRARNNTNSNNEDAALAIMEGTEM